MSAPMHIAALDVPEQPEELAVWLERYLFSDQLLSLISQLSAVHERSETDSAKPALDEILGSQRNDVLSAGLSELPHPQRQQLLTHPHRLLELQELVVTSGSDYWQQYASLDTSDQARLASTHAVLLEQIVAPSRNVNVPSRENRISPAWVVALAACVFVAVAIGLMRLGGSSDANVAIAWGWGAEGATTVDLPPAEFMSHLADAGEQFFKKRPSDRTSYRERLAQFRDGCQQLRDAPLRQLPEADREWLVTKCDAWMVNLDAHLTALDDAVEDFGTRRIKADQQIEKLLAALRARAAQMSGGKLSV